MAAATYSAIRSPIRGSTKRKMRASGRQMASVHQDVVRPRPERAYQAKSLPTPEQGGGWFPDDCQFVIHRCAIRP